MSRGLGDKDLKTLVDRLLLEQGQLDPLELLLAADLLAYEDFEGWRLGRRSDLQQALRAEPEQAVDLLQRAASYAKSQGLAATPLHHRGWAGFQVRLRVGDHDALERACSAVMAPPSDRHQLDLFQDSTALVLEDEVRAALAERRPERARGQVAQLMRQDPNHRRLHGYLRLVQAIDDDAAVTPEERLAELEAIEPLAHELLCHRARDYLAPLWTALARTLAGRPFDPAFPRAHAAYAWAGAERWEAVRETVEMEPRWREHAPLVLAHGEACWHGREPVLARRDWMWLAWRHPEEAERAFRSPALPDRRLTDLWNLFGDLDEPLETEDFPAWLLLEDPAAFMQVPPEPAPADERGTVYGLLHRLVKGEGGVALRRELAESHPALLRCFLARRRGGGARGPAGRPEKDP
jgi:hypothetical protein